MFEIFRQANPYLIVPPENNSYEFIAQLHAAAALHIDLRFEFGNPDMVNGITLAVAREGIPRPKTIAELKELINEPKWWKINFKTGEFAPRRRRGGVITETYIWSQTKSFEPRAWFTLDNYTIPVGEIGATKNQVGLIKIIDRGLWEFGFQQSYSHEYFARGKVFNGRYLFRRLVLEGARQEPLPPSTPVSDELEGATWLFIKTQNQTPYVLSLRCIEQKKLPSFGLSALPKALRRKVPEDLQFWNSRDKDTAHQKRVDLRKHFLEQDLIEREADDSDEFVIPKSLIFSFTKETSVKEKEEDPLQTYIEQFLKSLPEVFKESVKVKISRLNFEVTDSLITLDTDSIKIFVNTTKMYFQLQDVLNHAAAFLFAQKNPSVINEFYLSSQSEGGITEAARKFETNELFSLLNFAEAFVLWKQHLLTDLAGFQRTKKSFYSIIYKNETKLN